MTPKQQLELYENVAAVILDKFSFGRALNLLHMYGAYSEWVNTDLLPEPYLVESFLQHEPEKIVRIAKDFDVSIPWEVSNSTDQKPKTTTTMRNSAEKRIFISHSTEDRDIVGQLVKLVKASGVQSSQIFCSSLPGYGIPLGEDFMDYIKKELNNDVIVAFVLSSNFYASPVCLCEMGAAWINTKEHFPVLIPPFEFDEIKGVITGKQGIKINEKLKINQLKEKLEHFFFLTPVNNSVWEEERDDILKAINRILGSSTSTSYADVEDLAIFKDSNDVSKTHGQDDELWEDKIGPALERLEAMLLVKTFSALEVDYPIAAYLTPLGSKLRNEKFGNPKKKA